jgi:hypothetical protein
MEAGGAESAYAKCLEIVGGPNVAITSERRLDRAFEHFQGREHGRQIVLCARCPRCGRITGRNSFCHSGRRAWLRAGDHKLGHHRGVLKGGPTASTAAAAHNFELLGHHDLGLADTNGDVWVHGNFAYVGTWSHPCTARGVKIIDVSVLSNPQFIGTLAAREGTSAEDMVARRVSTTAFTGDLIAVGIQRCGADPALATQQFGLELWDVTNPYAPVKLSELGLANGGGGVHELDLFQRGGNVYALVATPFSEWFDPIPAGDFRIIDVTNPKAPVEVANWGAGANGFSLGPFFGQGSLGATFGHSARASPDGKKAYVSYWDLGVLTFDISDVTNPVLLSRTRFKPTQTGMGTR